jgi:hypothetical protein
MPDTNFLPSRDGLAFTNDWPPHTDAVTVSLPGVGKVAIGDASRGLCGGMVFTALDVFNAKLPPPSDPRPAPGDPLFGYIVRRLIDSWRVPPGGAKYYQWMITPDHTSEVLGFARRGVASWTIADEWKHVQADLDAGTPSTLGLVTVASKDPRQLGANHQVVAWGYEVNDTTARIKVYDPNTPRANGDDVHLSMVLDDPEHSAHITHDVNIAHDVRGFFRVGYRPSTPPT